MHATWTAIAALVVQRGVSDTVCVPVRSVGDVPGWVWCQANAHAGFLAAAATFGLFVVAVLRLRRDERGGDDRTDEADLRIANLAFPVRRTLAKSLDEGWRLDDGVLDRRDRAREIQRGFVEHVPRVEEMLDEASRASPAVAEAARRAARLFWDAADGVNDMAAFEPQYMGDDPSEGLLRGYGEARSTTDDCVEVLLRLDAPVRESGVG